MFRIATDRAPTHPGEMLREEFLTPWNISQRELAQAIHVPYRQVGKTMNVLTIELPLEGYPRRPSCRIASPTRRDSCSR